MLGNHFIAIEHRKNKKPALFLEYLILTSIVFLGLWGFISEGFAQIDSEINKIKNIRFAPHPLYSRVVFDLDKNVHYKIIPNFKNGVVSILFENSIISQKLRDKIISDKRIADIYMVETSAGEVRLDIRVNFTKNTFFHMPMKNPPRLVFDIKNKTQMVFKDRELKLAKAEKKAEAELEKEIRKEEVVKKTAEEAVKREKEKATVRRTRKSWKKNLKLFLQDALMKGERLFSKH